MEIRVRRSQSSDELYHWGIKGMRWGIRRYQNKDGSLTTLGKQHLAEKRIRTEENLSEKTIPKGTTMYRVTPEKTDEKSSGPMYVTYLDADRDMYREGTIVRNYSNKQLSNTSVYEHEFKLSKDIKIPSLKTVREIEERVVSNEKMKQEVAKSWMESFMMIDEGYSMKDVSTMSKISDRFDKITTDEQRRSLYIELSKKYGDYDGDYYYHGAKKISEAREYINSNDSLTIERSLGRATNVKNGIVKELKKLGYNAMYDNAGIGVGSDGKYSKAQEGVEPLIIFDPNTTLVRTTTQQIDLEQRRASGERYERWKNDRTETLKDFK